MNEVINRCGFCGETFQVDASDPHWITGRGPLCPNREPPKAIGLTPADLAPTKHDHVIEDIARCRKHNTIRRHPDEPCWQCWKEKQASGEDPK